MEKLPKNPKKISTADLLGLDLKNPSDRNYLRYERLLLELHKIMLRRGISGNQLAKRMGVSRQAIYDRFAGHNTTLEWIVRAAEALGVSMQVTFSDKPPKQHAVFLKKVA